MPLQFDVQPYDRRRPFRLKRRKDVKSARKKIDAQVQLFERFYQGRLLKIRVMMSDGTQIKI